MAISSPTATPRIIFACTIPTIIVILTYIWYKKKRDLQQQQHHHSSGGGGGSSVQCHDNSAAVEDIVDTLSSPASTGEVVDVDDEGNDLRKQTFEALYDSNCGCGDSPIVSSSTIIDHYECCVVSACDTGHFEVTPPLEELQQQEQEEATVLTMVTPSCSSTPEKTCDKMARVAIAKDSDEKQQQQYSSVKEASESFADNGGSGDHQRQHEVEGAATSDSPQKIKSKNARGGKTKVDAKNGRLKNGSSSPASPKSSPSAAVVAKNKAKTADVSPDSPRTTSSRRSKNYKTLRELSPKVPKVSDVVEEEHEQQQSVKTSVPDDDQTAVVTEEGEGNNTVVDLDKTLVEEDLSQSMNGVSLLESPNDTLVSEQKQGEEEEDKETVVVEAAADKTDVVDSSKPCPEEDKESKEGEEAEEEEEAASSVVAEHPPVVSSPGSTNDDTELHKLTNGTDTSAYGSASHSPAELLGSPVASNYSDLHSEGSSDSGKGCSDIHTLNGSSTSGLPPFTPLSVFEFEIPQELCGRLIGARGRYVNFIKAKSRANISIKRHPFNTDLKLCAVIGTEDDINAALLLIRKRFPINRFPCISMIQVNAPLLNNVPIPDTLQLHLPEGVTCDVILSSLVNAGHFFVQQPTHPTYPSLGQLDQVMLHCYMNGMGAPQLPKPVEPGIICAASTMGGWYRAQIVYVHPDAEECEVRFVDYGGYSQVTVSMLRQIRSDFMTLPFQASECYLGNVVPVDEVQGWTLEATSIFEQLAQGQILQAQIVAYSDDGTPYVHLYRIQGVMTAFINRELVNRGVAKWVDHQS